MMKTIKLGDICDLMTGGTPNRSRKEYFENGTIKWLVSGDIHKGEIVDCEGRITEAGLKNSNARLLPVNSVMIALNGQGKTRATVAMLRTKAACNQSLVSIYPKDDKKVLPEYIYWNLKGRYEELRKLTGDAGNDRRGLNMTIIRTIAIPEPPAIEKQRQIVKQLYSAFEKITQAEILVTQNASNTFTLQKSILNGYFSTKIGTQTYQLGEICDFVRGPFGGTLKKEHFKSDGYAVYEQRHAIHGMSTAIRYFIDEDKFNEMKRFEIHPGDLIMSCSGTLGKISIVPDNVMKGVINQALLKFTPQKNVILVDYLKYLVESRSFQKAIREYSGGSAIQNIASVKILKNINVSVPSIDIQKQITKRVSIAEEKVNHLHEKYSKKLAYLKALRTSLLREAFSGSKVE